MNRRKGSFQMNGFWKIFGVITAIFTAVVAALLVFDKVTNKNRIKGNYVDCEIFDN